MTISLDDLRVFAAVADAGSFREISKASARSATAVSRAVQRLEAELGITLLERTTRSVFPTREGALLLERLAPALLQVEAAVAWVMTSGGVERGPGDADAGNVAASPMPELARKTWP